VIRAGLRRRSISMGRSKTAMYLIGAERDGRMQLLCAPVPERERDYLQENVLPTLRPLSDTAYMLGPAVILGTLARYSYVLVNAVVYWCVEWEPGLLVVRLSGDGGMAWTAIRSPVPGFGGRTPLQEDIDAYDETADNLQYNLVFTAWDATVGDEKDRQFAGFLPADAETQRVYEHAMEHVDSLGGIIESKYGSDLDGWSKHCFANIKDWAGEGVRFSIGYIQR
jgi:hypothetical protein